MARPTSDSSDSEEEKKKSRASSQSSDSKEKKKKSSSRSRSRSRSRSSRKKRRERKERSDRDRGNRDRDKRDRGDRDRRDRDRRDRGERVDRERDRDRRGERRRRSRDRSRRSRSRHRSRSREKDKDKDKDKTEDTKKSARGIDRAIEKDRERKKREQMRAGGGRGGAGHRDRPPTREPRALREPEPLKRAPLPPQSALEPPGRAATRVAPAEDGEEVAEKEKPNFGLSGALAAETNTVNGVVLKWTEPPEARKPDKNWRLYVFKGDQHLNTLHIAKQSVFLVGREQRVADIRIDHPSASQQHAVIQYRFVDSMNDKGEYMKEVKPYIMDLVSTHGTFLNGEKIEPQRYIELFERDLVKFGLSTRDYVLLHDKSA